MRSDLRSCEILARAGLRSFSGFRAGNGLPALVSAADMLALVSLWEGFGLPVLEAMACGTAVLTTNCSSLPELAGDTAVLVDPYDVGAIANALERLLVDDAHRQELQRLGPLQATKFTWDITAEKLLEVVRSISHDTPCEIEIENLKSKIP